MGSVETLAHKGTSVVCQAVRRVIGNGASSDLEVQPCTLEVSDQGLRMVDRRKRDVRVSATLPNCYKFPFIITEKRALYRLFLLTEKCEFLRFSSQGSSIFGIYHQTPYFTKIRVSRV